ncbi:MAG: TIGR00730 family Rossman fold protein [Candidatus Latescibacterota bacterium]|nr:TIGR00730 family Rossman fold protein [Candidatus Latescibacterota bacterium]
MRPTHPRICIYCGSRTGADPVYEETARALGTALAQRGIGLVYGGGRVGMMGTLADAALKAGGEVIGVIPRALCERELAHDGLSELIVVDDMPQRKAQLVARAQALVALPGGYGTLEELAEALSWTQLDLHAKPIFLLNIDGYFDALLDFFDRAVATDFLRSEHRSLVQVAQQVDELLAALAPHI